VRAKTVTASVVACAVLVVVGKQLFDVSWESAFVLAPVFVLSFGGIVFLLMLWAKVIRDSLRS